MRWRRMVIPAIPAILISGSTELTKNISLVLDALREFGFGELGISVADLSTPNSVVQLGHPPARIDLLSSIDGVSFAACYAKRIVRRNDDVDLQVNCVADFRVNKLATGRLGQAELFRT